MAGENLQAIANTAVAQYNDNCNYYRMSATCGKSTVVFRFEKEKGVVV